MIQSEGHGLYLRGWQVAKGEDREVRFIPREKPDREGRGTSEPKREIPRPGVGSRGGSFPGEGERGGSPQFGADVTDCGLDPGWKPGSAASRLHILRQSFALPCLPRGTKGKQRPAKEVTAVPDPPPPPWRPMLLSPASSPSLRTTLGY